MTYTDIYRLEGLYQQADYGSGVEFALGIAEAFPESGLQIGLWLDGYKGCRDIVSGLLGDTIYRLFDFIHSYLPKSTPKVFLRIGYEFDNPSFGYSDHPLLYIDAFRKLVHSCEDQLTAKVCHEKIAFVWHSWGAPRQQNTTLMQFYPGDEFVDWVAVSIFQQLYPWANDNNKNRGDFAGGNILDVKEVLDFAKSIEKPIMIAESTPFGGIDFHGNSTSDIWNLWFQKVINIIDEYDIGMWSYINCDWDSQPMWNGIGFGDTRLSSSNNVMDHWWNQILNNDNNNSRFLFRIENCHQDDLSFEPVYNKFLSKSIIVTNMPINSWRIHSTFLSVFCAGFAVLLLVRLVRYKTKRRCCYLAAKITAHQQSQNHYIQPNLGYSEATYGTL